MVSDGFGRLAVLALDFAVHQQVEFLLGGAQLDVGLKTRRRRTREQRIEQLVHGDGLIRGQARAEILALEHARQAIFSAELHDFLAAHLAEPFAVVADFRLLRIEDFVDLFEIGLGVGVHLLAAQRRARFRLAGGIADHGGKIADEKNGGVPFVLEVLELAQHDGMAEVQIGRGGIDAEVDAQGLACGARFFEFGAEFVFGNDLGGAAAQRGQLFVSGAKDRVVRGRHYALLTASG